MPDRARNALFRFCKVTDCQSCLHGIFKLLACGCGNETREVRCDDVANGRASDFICERVCNSKLSCRRHRCQKVLMLEIALWDHDFIVDVLFKRR